MNLEPIIIREQIIAAVREFFSSQGFHEVITPTLNSALPMEPTIYPFETSWKTIHGEKPRYLSTSPEAGLKKMIAMGLGNCFAISKSFRNLEEEGTYHIPEFLMLEWYRVHADYTDIMHDTQHLILFVKHRVDDYLKKSQTNALMYKNHKIHISDVWPVYSMIELFKKYATLDLQKLFGDNELRDAAREKGYSTDHANWEQLFNQLFLNEIEPHIGMNPCFITDFPAKISPLCAPKKDDQNFAERFEFYFAGLEIANGNTEQTNIDEIKKVFAKEQIERKKKKLISPPIDTEFLRSLQTMQPTRYAGIGLGIDRLAMILSNMKTITEVEPLACV